MRRQAPVGEPFYAQLYVTSIIGVCDRAPRGVQRVRDMWSVVPYDQCHMDTVTLTPGALHQCVLELLTNLDPYGLNPGMPGSPPLDEYASEATPMAEHLLAEGTISTARIDIIWSHWFSQTLTEAIGQDAAGRFADELNALALRTPPAGR